MKIGTPTRFVCFPFVPRMNWSARGEVLLEIYFFFGSSFGSHWIPGRREEGMFTYSFFPLPGYTDHKITSKEPQSKHRFQTDGRRYETKRKQNILYPFRQENPFQSVIFCGRSCMRGDSSTCVSLPFRRYDVRTRRKSGVPRGRRDG